MRTLSGAGTIIFDLDGTLVDTAPDLVNALNAVFRREGLPALSLQAAKGLIGGGMRPFIERGLEREGRVGTPETIDLLYADLVAHYSEHIADESLLFPGVVPALDILAAQGFRLAVCTNKLEWLAVRLLTTLGIAGRFAAICGSDTFGVQKPDPRVLPQAAIRAGGQADRAIMVGDSGTDIAAARAAAMPVIAVDFGYTEIPVDRLGPDRIISRFEDLPAAVSEVMADLRTGPVPAV